MRTSDEFVDVHCHVFTPDSFLGLIGKLARLDLIDYEVAAFHPTERDTFEFYVSLRLLDVSAGREQLKTSQLASADPKRARSLPRTQQPRGAQPALVRMEVSELEERLLKAKRRSLARVRALLKRRN